MELLKWLKGSPAVSSESRPTLLLIVVSGKIYSWDGRQVELRGGSGVVHCVAQYKGAVFGGEIGSISNYASGINLNHPTPIAERGSVTALCLHDKTLYDASAEGGRFEIKRALIGDLICVRPRPIIALVSHNGVLYDGGLYGVFETATSREISDMPCDAMCSHNGQLYVALDRNIFDVELDEPVYQASARVTALCSYRDRLLHADFGGGIWDSMDQRLIVSYEAIDKVRGRKSKTQAASCLLQSRGLT